MAMCAAIWAGGVEAKTVFPSVLSSSGEVVFEAPAYLEPPVVYASDVIGLEGCFGEEAKHKRKGKAKRRHPRKRCERKPYTAGAPSPLRFGESGSTQTVAVTRPTARFTDATVPSLQIGVRHTTLHFQAPADGMGKKVQRIGRIVDRSGWSTYVFEEGDYYIDALDIQSAHRKGPNRFVLKTEGRVRLFLKEDSVISKRTRRRRGGTFVALNAGGNPGNLLIVSAGSLRIESYGKTRIRGFVFGYDDVTLAGAPRSLYAGAFHSCTKLTVGHRGKRPKAGRAGRFRYLPGALGLLDLSFFDAAPPLSLTLLSAPAQTSVPYRGITLKAEAQGATSVTATNLTLQEEHNRTVSVEGAVQEDGKTFYLYRVALVPGENRIAISAENNRTGAQAREEIVIPADANLSLPLQLRASAYRGVESLTTTIIASTLLDAKTMLFDTDGDGIIDQALPPEAHTENNVTYYTAELNATYTEEGRYRPRVTVETQEGPLFSSGAFALSLDVVSDANQKDPKGAEPIDIAKAFVKALIEDDRDSVERLTGYSANLLAFIYEDKASLERAKRLAKEIDPDSWKQTYRSNGSIKVTAEANDDQFGKITITIEVMYAYGDGAGSGRMLYVSDVY